MIFDTVQEWAHCREAMLKAIERCDGTHDEDDVLRQILTGQLKLWREGSSAVLTEFQSYPKFRALHCFLVGGTLAEVLKIEERLVPFAILNGCIRPDGMPAITACGRSGWARVLKDRGWREVTTFIQKDVS